MYSEIIRKYKYSREPVVLQRQEAFHGGYRRPNMRGEVKPVYLATSLPGYSSSLSQTVPHSIS